MEQNETRQEQQQQQQQFQCTGDCLKCIPIQRQYCASQHAYNTMRMVQSMNKELEALKGTVGELSEKLGAIQGNEALLFTPSENASGELTERPATEVGVHASEVQP